MYLAQYCIAIITPTTLEHRGNKLTVLFKVCVVVLESRYELLPLLLSIHLCTQWDSSFHVFAYKAFCYVMIYVR